jgi:hypothetical protein
MQPLKARVKNGRLLLDEPTDLPDGEVVYLQQVDRFVVVSGEEMDARERDALNQELEASIAEADRSDTEDFSSVLAAVRQQR